MAGASAIADAKAAEVSATFARQGLLRTFGAEMTSLEAGRCTITTQFKEAVGQQHGFFHGGVVGAIADTAGGCAALTLLPLGSEVLTLEYKINFVRPAAGEKLVAEGTVLRAGKSICVTRVDVFVERSGERTLCAALQQSMMRAPTQPEDQ